MNNQENLADEEKQNKRTAKYVLDTDIRKQTKITQIRHKPFYKQLNIKNQMVKTQWNNKYHTDGTILISTGIIVERDKIDTPNTQLQDHCTETHLYINVREDRRGGNQEWTFQRHRQHWEHKAQDRL